MRCIALICLLSGIASAQIDPEAARLFRSASTHALQNLSSFDLEADEEITNQGVSGPVVTPKHISISVRKPDREKLSVRMIHGIDSFIAADNFVTAYSEEYREYATRPAALRPDSFLNPLAGREVVPFNRNLSAAQILREEILRIDGKEYPCTVIHLVSIDPMYGIEVYETLWVDKQSGVALRQEMSASGERSPKTTVMATRFLTGDAVLPVSFDTAVQPPDWHQNDDLFEKVMLALPLAGPDFAFSGPGGTPFTVLNLAGKPTLLSFSAPGCLPCAAHMKAFEVAAKTLRESWGDAVNVIVTDSTTLPAVSSSPNYTTVFATPEQVERQGIQVLPALMATTPRRTIYRTVQGQIGEEQMMTLVEKAKDQPAVSASTMLDSAMVMVGQVGVVGPVATYRPPVAMTSEARALGVFGIVGLSVVVQRDGTVKRATVTHSLHPVLDALAAEAVQKWLFKPGTMDGQPANVIMSLRIEFAK